MFWKRASQRERENERAKEKSKQYIQWLKFMQNGSFFQMPTKHVFVLILASLTLCIIFEFVCMHAWNPICVHCIHVFLFLFLWWDSSSQFQMKCLIGFAAKYFWSNAATNANQTACMDFPAHEMPQQLFSTKKNCLKNYMKEKWDSFEQNRISKGMTSDHIALKAKYTYVNIYMYKWNGGKIRSNLYFISFFFFRNIFAAHKQNIENK